MIAMSMLESVTKFPPCRYRCLSWTLLRFEAPTSLPKCVNQPLRPLRDFCKAVLGTEQFRAKAKAGCAGRQPVGDVFGRDSAHREYIGTRWKHGTQRL